MIHPYGATWYVLLRGPATDPMAKEADFFVSQGGHREPWGRGWVPVRADGLAHAKLIALVLQTSKGFPDQLERINAEHENSE